MAAGVVLAAASASQALTIIPTFDATITGLSNASAVEASINQALAFYNSNFSNNVTVTIDFQTGAGLGGSNTGLYGLSYTNYTNLLKAQAAANPQNTDLATAVANLQYGTQKQDILGTSADLRALGVSQAVAGVPVKENNVTTDYDGVITLNTAIMNFTNTTDPTLYGANQVIQHEVDEVLGMGGPGTLVDLPFGPTFNSKTYMGAEDLYRYSAPHTASFTDSPSATSYFSIDGGVTDVRGYNQNSSLGDLGDWVTSCAVNAPQFVQDYAGCPGKPQLGLTRSSPEVMGLQAIGFDLMAKVPEPAAWALMIAGFGLTGAALRRRRTPAPIRIRR